MKLQNLLLIHQNDVGYDIFVIYGNSFLCSLKYQYDVKNSELNHT